MCESERMIDHINKLRSLAEQLDSVGAPVSEDDQVATLLCSLPDSYANLNVALESRADSLTLEFVTSRLIHEEKKRLETASQLSESMEKALIATKNMSYRRRQSPGPRNKRGKCFNCGLKGHWAKDCTRPKKPKESGTEDTQIAATDSQSLLSMNSTSALDESLVWYVDSGASRHMSSNKEWMQDYAKLAIPEKIRLGDNRLVEAEGKGTVWIKLKVGDKYKPAELSDVLYVPSLNKNLFSVSTVTKKGFSIMFDANQCVILDRNGTILGSGRSGGKLYTLDASHLQNDMHEVNTASDQRSLNLWHQRFGHLGVNNLKLLNQQGLVDGLRLETMEEMKFCEGCTLGKQTRNAFSSKQATRATKLLQIVHSDKPSTVAKVDSSTSTDEVQIISVTSEDDAQDQSDDCSEDQVEDIVDNATDSSAEDLPENIQESQMPRKSTRVKHIPDRGAILTGDWWNGEDLLNVELQEVPEEQKTIQQALSSTAKQQWKQALDNEYSSLMKNQAWNLFESPRLMIAHVQAVQSSTSAPSDHTEPLANTITQLTAAVSALAADHRALRASWPPHYCPKPSDPALPPDTMMLPSFPTRHVVVVVDDLPDLR
eukprot:gene5845-6544_t